MSTDLTARDAEIARFCTDSAFIHRLHKEVRLDLSSPTIREYHDEAWKELKAILISGVLRAWMNRFLDEHIPEFKFPRFRDISADYESILATYPSFATYTPSSPLTDSEVLYAARIEFTHAFTMRARKWYDAISINSVNEYRTLADSPEHDPGFGPAVLRVAQYIWQTFGTAAMICWVFARYVFDNEYRTTLRALSPSLEENSAAFHQAQIYLRRALQQLDSAMTACRTDLVLQDLAEAV